MKVLVIATLLVVAVSAGGSGGHGAGYGGDYNVPTSYKFSYGVDDPHYGPKFSHSESNDGKAAQGYYSVELPDGRTQHVKYHSDQYGYGGHNAQVTYSGGYDKGYSGGYDKGYSSGYDKKYSDGYKRYNSGYDSGYKSG